MLFNINVFLVLTKNKYFHHNTLNLGKNVLPIFFDCIILTIKYVEKRFK